MTQHDIIESSIGPILLVAEDGALMRINLTASDAPETPPPGSRRDSAALHDAATQLREYFAGSRREFSLSLAPRGTAFQRQVWECVSRIGYGTTATYAEIADAVGCPRAARAVGAANGRNPLPIVVPCHRVIGADGGLTGYHGGVRFKQALLALEHSA